MSVPPDKLVELVEEFKKNYPRGEKRRQWELQSSIFKELWENVIMGDNKLENSIKDVAHGDINPDLDPLIALLDVNGSRQSILKRRLTDEERRILGKGYFAVGDGFVKVRFNGIDDIDSVAFLGSMYQNQWRDSLSAIKQNIVIKSKIEQLLKSTSENEIANLLDEIRELGKGNPYRLGGSDFTVLNAILFINNPSKHVAVVSLTDRLRIIKFFGLNEDMLLIEGYANGEKNIMAENLILKFNEVYGTDLSPRELSKFFYSESPNVISLWKDEKVTITTVQLFRDSKPLKCPVCGLSARFKVDESNNAFCRMEGGHKFKVTDADIA